MSYDDCKVSKLKFKTNSAVTKKKRKKKESREKVVVKDPDSDSEEYDGWWKMKSSTGFDSSMMLSIEQGAIRRFWRALDNGRIVLGPPHAMGEGPSAEEQFQVIKTADNDKFGIKTGFMKYITVAKDNTLQGISDAIGPRECFEAIFQDGKVALSCGNSCFASTQSNIMYSNSTVGVISATAFKVSDTECLKLRTNADRNKKPEASEQDVDFGRLDVAELSYVKKFQSFKNGKIVVNPNDRSLLSKAREDGKLHEALLDRRSKMKHDKFC